jgi:hypothetical protein
MFQNADEAMEGEMMRCKGGTTSTFLEAAFAIAIVVGAIPAAVLQSP